MIQSSKSLLCHTSQPASQMADLGSIYRFKFPILEYKNLQTHTLLFLRLSSYMKKPLGPPPPSYTCFRCGRPGHYIRQCPTYGVRDQRELGQWSCVAFSLLACCSLSEGWLPIRVLMCSGGDMSCHGSLPNISGQI